MCSLSGEQNCIIQRLLSSHSVGGRPVQSSLNLCTGRPLKVWWYQLLYNTISPPDDEHIVLETCRWRQ